MSGSFGEHVSSFLAPNALLDMERLRQAPQIAEDAHQNALMQRQQYQQQMGAADTEAAARLAGTLLTNFDTPEQRAAAYPGFIAEHQARGLLKNAPAEYPGDERAKAIWGMGTSAEKQAEMYYNRGEAKRALGILSGGAGQPGAGGAPGGVPAPAGGGFTGDREKDRAIIVKQESGGDPTVLNYVARQDPTAYARGATASGKYQFVNSTWAEGMQLAGLDPKQYPTARDAPEGVQDKVFDAVYGKYGTKPWEKGPKDWVRDEHGNYQVATVRPPAGSPGGTPVAPGTPAPYQVAGQPVGPPGTDVAAPGAAAPVAAPPVPGGVPAAPPAAPGAAPAPVTAPAPAPFRSSLPPLLPSGLDATQEALIRERLTGRNPNTNAILDDVQKMQAANRVARQQEETSARLLRTEERTVQQQEQAAADRAAAAARDTKRLELQINEAKRAGLPTGYKLDDNGKAVRIDGLPPDPAVLEAQAKAGAQAKQQFDMENTLRDEFQKLTGDFRIVQTSYENIRSAAKANDGAGDMSMLYNYVRLLDPTSVVRESEFASAAASGSFGERVQGAVQRVLNGGRMPESLRQSFIREGGNLYNNQLKSHDAVANQYETLAKRSGLEPDRVVTRFNRPQDTDIHAPPASLLKEGIVTDFANGQRWTLKGGQPAQVK